jgi:hypothetical protein
MTPCVIWTASCNHRGYGQVRVGDKMVGAHRKAYADHHGLDVLTMEGHVLHTCDTPPCVNPAHLRLGTHLDNMQDKVAKGRQARGDSNGRSRLTSEDIHTIREVYIPRSPSNGYGNSAELCLLYGIDRSHLSRIIRQKAWSDDIGLTDTSGAVGTQ